MARYVVKNGKIEPYQENTANVSSNLKNDKWYNNFFQKGDSNPIKATLSTANDAIGDFLTGALTPVENVVDFGANIVASAQNALGYEEAAQKTRDFANRNSIENMFKDEEIEKASVFGSTTDKITNLIGYTTGLMYGGKILSSTTGVKNLGITGKNGKTLLGGSFSGGNIGLTISGRTLNLPTLSLVGGATGGLQEANSKENVSEKERWTKALSSSLIEGTSEGLFGILGVGGSDFSETLIKNITSKFSSRAGKMLVQTGISATGEMAEEFLSYVGNYLSDNHLIDKLGDADFSSKFDWGELGEQMALAFVSSTLSQGGGSIVNSNNAIKSAEQQLGRKLTTQEKAQVTQSSIEGTLIEKINKLKKEQKTQNAVTKMPTVNDIVAQKQNTNMNQINSIENIAKQNNENLNIPIRNVNDIVNVENNKKNFATANNTLSPIQTSETNSSTSSFYANNSTLNDKKSQILSTSNIDSKLNNNIKIGSEKQKQLNQLDSDFKSFKSMMEKNYPIDKKFRDKRVKGYAMELAAQKREIIQGDWLIPIEGGLTEIELSKKIDRLKSNYFGKEVIVDGKNAKIIGNSFGKVGVRFNDGIESYFEKEQITPVENIEEIIKQQKKKIEQLNQTKGNIPINQELLGKYSTVREIFDNNTNNFNGIVEIKNDISEINNINPNELNVTQTKQIANEIFQKYNSKKVFINNGNKIVVNKSGINESVEKIFNNRNQRNLLKEHFKVFSDLGDIIEHAILVNQTTENKGRNNIKLWNYYYDGLNIDGELYRLVFDVRSMDNGENQYRVQRLEKDTKKTGDYDGDASNNTRILPPYSQPVSYDNNTTISQNSQIASLPNNSNMQNSENDVINTYSNDNKVLNPIEISNLKKKNANTTPILPTINVSTGKGESKFASNIENKTNMLTEESKLKILSDNDVNFYQQVTNKESLDKAYSKLNEDGESEVQRWFRMDSNEATDVDVAEGWILLKQYQDSIEKTTDLVTKDQLNKSMVQVAKHMREMGTKAGQTVQAYNILNRLTPEGMVYYAQSELSEAFEVMSKNKTQEWIESNKERFDITPDETQFIMKTMQEVQRMENGRDKNVKLAEIQKILSDKLPPERGAGIKAWMRISMLFNPKTQVRNVMGNAIIAPVNALSDFVASKVDSAISKSTGVRTTGKTDYKSYAKGFKKGLFESYDDFKRGINTRNIQGNRFEVGQGKSFDDNTRIGKVLNNVDSLLSFMLDAGDRGFYEASFTNSINNQLVLNNKTDVTQEMIDIATQEALQRTWQDNNDYTRFVLSIRSQLNKINIKGYGLGDVLIPFAKTPANLTKAIVDYSPLGMIKTINEGINLKRSLTNGQFTAQMQHQFVQDLGKATAGTILYVLGYALAKAGMTTGESDDDKDVSNFMKNTLGVSSYSIKIGNKTFTYDWMQPVAAPFAITANIVNKQKQEANLLENVISSLDTAGNILLQQSFLDSLNTVFNNNDGIVSGLQEAILELPSRAIPTLFKQIVDLTDSTQRTSFEYDKPLETMFNKVKAKIPGLSKTLAPSVDTLGREIQRYGGKNNLFNVFLNPANVNTENVNESAKEIYNLYKETGETTIMPRVAPYYINKNGNKIILNSQQRAEYQKISGEIIEKNIQKLIGDSNYDNLNNDEKVEVISDIVNFSYNVAQSKILGTEISDTYKKAYFYSLVGNVSDYYLYKSHEFESDYYENGNVITNSKKNKIIKYINGLNLTIPQKAILIKMEYSSYDNYNSQIVSYINKMNYSKFEKASILKQIGFDNYDKYLINYVNSQKIGIDEKIEILEDLGFTIRNGRVYS